MDYRRGVFFYWGFFIYWGTSCAVSPDPSLQEIEEEKIVVIPSEPRSRRGSPSIVGDAHTAEAGLGMTDPLYLRF